MRKILLLCIMLLALSTTCFAYHTPDREELNKIQSAFSGYYFDEKGKEITNYLHIYDEGNIEFLYAGEYHDIQQPNLQVDFNNGMSIQFEGNCSKPDCNFKKWKISLSPLGYSRYSRGYSFSLVMIRWKENFDKSKVTKPEDVMETENYLITKK